MAIKPDKTADFEQRHGQDAGGADEIVGPGAAAAGRRLESDADDAAARDGTIAYVHIVHPVVKDADYAIMQTLYEAFPDERQALYEHVSRRVREERLARHGNDRG